jgi:hypothetical protein
MPVHQPFAASIAGALVVTGVTVVGGVETLQPFAALAPFEAAPMPTAVMATTARPAAKRAARFGPHDVAFFVDFMFKSFVKRSGEEVVLVGRIGSPCPYTKNYYGECSSKIEEGQYYGEWFQSE